VAVGIGLYMGKGNFWKMVNIFTMIKFGRVLAFTGRLLNISDIGIFQMRQPTSGRYG
jgi:hypothetical protein